MIKTIIFDAFGTLFKVTGGASAKTIISHIENAGQAVCEKDFLSEWRAFYKAKTQENTPFRTEREIFIARIEIFYNQYGVIRDAAADADTLLSKAHMRKVYNDTLPVLSILRKCHTVYIGSNTDNSVIDSVIYRNGIKVDKVYTSENLRCYKPSHKFYRTILNENKLKPDEVLFVGDSVTDDIIGPQKLGIKTCLIDRNNTDNKSTKPDIIVKNLLEIIEKIKEL